MFSASAREGILGYHWPAEAAFTRRVLPVEREDCSQCGSRLHVCDHRFHRIHTFDGPVEIVCKLAHCPAADCPAHSHTLSPPSHRELSLLALLPEAELEDAISLIYLGTQFFLEHPAQVVLDALLPVAVAIFGFHDDPSDQPGDADGHGSYDKRGDY